MSTITRRPPRPPGWVPSHLARLTVDQYEAMVDSGVFTKRDRLHLINGYLVTKVSKNPPHTRATGLTFRSLGRVIPDGWYVRKEDPVRLPPGSMPEPDIAVARGSLEDCGDRHPGPGDLALIVEVSDSMLASDREMIDVYGPAGIPVYWIVNLIDRQVEVHTGPGADGYSACVTYKPGESVPVMIDGAEVGQIAVSDILPSLEPSAGGNEA